MSESIQAGVPSAKGGWIPLSGETENRLVHFLRRLNWPLVIGGVITVGLVLVAIYGPEWALHDPMKENYAFKVNGQVVRPPYPPFTLPGYPLGTDQFGRDLLSRVLFGIRPTLLLVGMVAAFRLILGLLLGVWIGWSVGMRARFLETVLSFALAIPVLIVALIGIGLVGLEKGLIAFIFGLAITGWAETARIVSSQTRIIKGQAYIEASQALGASDRRIFRKHVFHHISPLVWMLLAFEVSATLMVVSELGFLGYYIGGGVWIEVLDFVSINTTGLPELGQMLSTALYNLTKPLVLIIVGTFVFLMILGFNLLGEGLRLRLSRQVSAGRTRSLLASTMVGAWWEDSAAPILSDWLDRNSTRLGYAGALALLLVGFVLWRQAQPEKKPTSELAYLPVPGGHLWASEQHDAQGTRWVKASGPKTSDILWTYQTYDHFVGGPAVAADGTIYAATDANDLVAVSPEGKEIWRANLEALPLGSPALGPGGEIYVSDAKAGLSAFSPQGKPLWRFVPKGGREGTSGPIVDGKGNIYYARVDSVQAVAPDGNPLWSKVVFDGYTEEPPVISAGGGYVFLVDGASSASSGAPLDLGQLTSQEIKFTTPAFFVGADGNTYIRSGHEVSKWVATKDGVKTGSPITWNSSGTLPVPPISQGVTPDELVWMFYAGDFSDTHLVWLDKSSRLISNQRFPERQSTLIAIDENSTSYICSNNFKAAVKCRAVEIGEKDPVWELNLGDNIQVVGGALVPGRMYITTDAGKMIAVGNSGESANSIPNVQVDNAIETPTKTSAPTLTNTPSPSPNPQPTATTETSILLPGLIHGEGQELFLPLIQRWSPSR